MKKALLQKQVSASASPISPNHDARPSPMSSLVPSNVMPGLVSLAALVVIGVIIDRLLKGLGV